LGRFIQPDTIVPEPGNPQALNRYSYGLNNPVKYADPTGHLPKEDILQHFGVETWDEVLALFAEGGRLAGLWGWLETLRQAVLGDEIDVLAGAMTQWPSGTSVHKGVLGKDSSSRLYVGNMLADDVAKMGNAYVIGRYLPWDTRASSRAPGLPMELGPYYADRQYLHIKFEPSKIDWIGAAVDVFGIVGDIAQCLPAPAGAAIWATSQTFELEYAIWRAAEGDFAPAGQFATGKALEEFGVLSPWTGYLLNLYSLKTNLSNGIYKSLDY
jgi:hypothetical protein